MDRLPLAGEAQVNTHVFEDFPGAPGQLPPFHPILRVSAGYVETMGIPLVAGRSFEPADVDTPHGAVLVSESLARHYWPGESAVGRRIRSQGDAFDWEVVGVAENVHFENLRDEPSPLVYFPLVQGSAEEPIGTRCNGGLGDRLHQRPFAGGMAGIHYHREMRQLA